MTRYPAHGQLRSLLPRPVSARTVGLAALGRRRLHRLRVLSALTLAISSLPGAVLFGPTTASATPHTVESQFRGLDTCSAPSASTMDTFWSNSSPWYNWGIYIGGVHRLCSQPNLTASWITHVTNTGWGLLPLWVGPQLPCSGYTHRFSYNTSTAYNQGRTEAASAVNAAQALGMGYDFPIAYDLEGTTNTITSSCIDAAKAFHRGWTSYLKEPPAQTPGWYGPSCNPDMDIYAYTSPHVYYIWGAWWNGNPSTSDLKCVASNHWTQKQRHKQYDHDDDIPWGGKTVFGDRDCSNGPVFGNANRYGDTVCL